ncbi:hypothetical protein QF041_002680 [Paenibacillus sp. W2I17]|nr:hypothetical protein [Paenibacillus sp. W2I17]
MLCINYNPANHDIHGFAGFLRSRVYLLLFLYTGLRRTRKEYIILKIQFSTVLCSLVHDA